MTARITRTVFFLCLAGASTAALAQADYPSRPIRFLVGVVPGGAADTLARAVGQRYSMAFNQQVIVDNRPGANQTIAADLTAKAQPDGYTIVIVAAGHAISPALYKLPYDAQKDFSAIGFIAAVPNVLVVNPSLPVASVKEFIAYAKAHPDALNFGSGSTGSAGHLAGELFKAMAGVRMVHVPYKGAGPAMQDLIGGRIQLMFDNLASSLAQMRAGRVRALAVTTAKRSALAPELPTIAESGLPCFDISTWFGVFAPGGTPRDIVERLHAEFVKALADPAVRETMLKLGAEPVGNTPAEFAAYIQSEARKYAEVIKASGARVD